MRLDELAARIGCELQGDGGIEVGRVATLDDAQPGDVTFLSNPRYARTLPRTRASAVIVSAAFEGALPAAALRAADPYLALARALEIFAPPRREEAGIHPTALVHPTARLGPDASVGAYAVIGAGTRVGARARIGPHVVVGPATEIGDDFVAHAHVSVRERVRIGHRVTIQDGAIIGSDGFGYAVTPEGTAHKMPQTGTVILEDDVEVGANTTIDRATVGATRICRGAKIDNLVMVAHGCEIGEGCFLAAQVGLAGSTTLGRFVQLGGQVGVAGHLSIGDFSRVSAKSGVPNDVPAGKTIGGYPAADIAQWRRQSAALARLPELLQRVRRLERARSSGGGHTE